MSHSLQDRVTVVLVRARNPSNIGAVARAMHDFGFSRMCVVNPFSAPFEAARLATGDQAEKSAVHSTHILRDAREAGSVAEAVAGCTLVLGTTAVGSRVLEHRLHTLHDAAAEIREHLAHGPEARVALLFGSEKTGLSNDELSHCHALLTIPMSPAMRADEAEPATAHLSMNLGQAAAVCLYELSRGVVPPPRQREQHPATAGDQERLTTLLLGVMAQTGYTRRYPANARENAVRRLVGRMRLDRDDAAVWTGVMRQLLRGLPAEPSGDEAFDPAV